MTSFKKITTQLNDFRSTLRLDPVRDWLVLIGLAGVIFLAVIVWNLWLFSQISVNRSSTTENPAARTLVAQDSFDTISALFLMRSTEAAKYENGIYHYEDPSL